MNATFEQLLKICQELVTREGGTTANGENFIDVPKDKDILHSITLWPTEEKKVQVNVTTEHAYPAFEWFAEITIDDRSAGNYSHYLLRTDHTLVETYGKNVTDVTQEAAENLLRELQSI